MFGELMFSDVIFSDSAGGDTGIPGWIAICPISFEWDKIEAKVLPKTDCDEELG